MRSEHPKVLHELCGRPMITHILRALEKAGVERLVVVIGPDMEEVRGAISSLANVPVQFVVQRERLGTGHAVRQAEKVLAGEERPILVTYGDTVLYRPETFAALLEEHAASEASATVLTAEVPDPTGYGRVVRDAEGRVRGIVEQKDAGPEEREIREINTGTYVFAPSSLWDNLARLSPQNAQGEYYLTDVVALLNDAGMTVNGVRCADADEARGINDRSQLAEAEAILRERARVHWMSSGVTFVDPSTVVIDPDVTIGVDTTIGPFSVLEGRTDIGSGCRVGPGATVKDAKIDDDVHVVHSVVSGVHVRKGARIGPGAFLGAYADDE